MATVNEKAIRRLKKKKKKKKAKRGSREIAVYGFVPPGGTTNNTSGQGGMG
tara:strand:- start:1137 stop:1289 length:153 start_codon:yes stop_codon:yes gene_type:complete